MRVLFRIALNSISCPTIGIAFPQYGIHGTSLYHVVAHFYLLFFSTPGFFWIVRYAVTFSLKLSDRFVHLGERRADIWKFDDIGVGTQG